MQKITVACIYAPNEDSPAFFSTLQELLMSRHEHKVIIGDFNLTLDVEMDRLNTYCNNNKAKEEVEQLMDTYYLHDIWRLRNPEVREYSWRKKCELNKASRIDLSLVSAGLDQYVEYVQYLSSIKTDHRAIYMVIDMLPFERGIGYWKFNSSLLTNKEYLVLMQDEINKSLKASQHKNPVEKWETLKDRIKKVSVKFLRQKVSEDKLIIGQLSEIVNEYEANLPLPEDDDKLLTETKADLEDKLLERTKGIMFRSKVRWQEEGESNTKYFFSLEKARYNSKTCYKMINDQEQEVTNPSDILNIQKEYYRKLYEEDEFVNFNLINNTDTRVPKSIQQCQNTQITIKDLENAIKTMKNNKTPGSDGIPVDFYKVFWTQLKETFYQMMQETYSMEKLHKTAREGILNLIPKAEKDTRYVKNLRPITLLNTDYKIIEKAIANKMIPALEHIIHADQRGFMKERRISVNIRKMLDIMHEAEKEDLEAVVLSLDFVKCFDKCSFKILHGSLDFFGFGQIVKTWTEILYRDFSVKVQNNGYFSETIDIKKGVHQGGCCSSIYFLVIAEILAMSLRDNQEIEGITIQDIKNLLNQFADDMDIFSTANEKSIKAIYEELDKFKYQSGFTVSYEKTTLYRIGSLRHSNAAMYNLDQYRWSNQDITVLGVQITHENLMEKNYNAIIPKAKQTLNAWYNRGLSLIGKIQVVNTLVASLFVYKMMVLPLIPKKIEKNLNNIIREFIWNGKKSKIAYEILQNPKKEGGLGLVNLRNRDIALKATWPQILNKEQQYASMVYRMMGVECLQEDIWRVRLLPEDIKFLKIENVFWKDVLESWTNYNYSHNFRIENQLLWYNSNIRIGGKPILWKNNLEKGLKYIYQLFKNGSFKSGKETKEQYGLSELKYNSLKVAIPIEWKTFFMENSRCTYFPLPPHSYDQAISVYGINLSRRVYQYIAGDAIIIHNKYVKWKMDLGYDIAESLCDFNQEIRDIYKVTNIPKYRSFQYRILLRGLVTNIHLNKWKITDSNLCSLCKTEIESVTHLLCDCIEIKPLWDKIAEYIEERFSIGTSTLNVTNILFNKIVPMKSHAVNFICLIAKQYIYSQKCLGKAITFPGLLSKIKSVENVEKYIAVKNGKINVHVKKWGHHMENNNLVEFITEYNSQPS